MLRSHQFRCPSAWFGGELYQPTPSSRTALGQVRSRREQAGWSNEAGAAVYMGVRQLGTGWAGGGGG